ncbi:MAG: response regulator [Elusimicrobiota bacterium]
MIAQILLADDNPGITESLGDYLRQRGHRVIIAEDGYQLAQKAAEHRPHLIVADVQMPGAYGSSAYQVLQKDANTNKIPVIFISAHPLSKIRAILPIDPKTRFLQKPLDLKALDAMIAELLPLGGYCP